MKSGMISSILKKICLFLFCICISFGKFSIIFSLRVKITKVKNYLVFQKNKSFVFGLLKNANINTKILKRKLNIKIHVKRIQI